ncbi:MAG TPA: Imm21 family immunity protein [Planctomycetota bacterium]|nr:Imm21 family immunity protein [Planctomycetota bacterium]
MSDLKWVNTVGGPFLLLPAECLRSWNGSDLPAGNVDPEDPDGSDYDRACWAEDEDVIPVGSGSGLVLRSKTLQFAAWPVPESAGIVLVKGFASSEKDIVSALRGAPDRVFVRSQASLVFNGPHCYLLAAACSGQEVLRYPDGTLDWLRLPIRPGRYELESGAYAPNAETRLKIYRLSPSPARN